MANKATSKKATVKTSVKLAVKTKKSIPVKKEVAAKKTDLPTAAVMRIAKASGAERVGADGVASISLFTERYLGKLVKEATKLASEAGRKTLKGEDVENASQIL
jgi:DNA-binding protein